MENLCGIKRELVLGILEDILFELEKDTEHPGNLMFMSKLINNRDVIEELERSSTLRELVSLSGVTMEDLEFFIRYREIHTEGGGWFELKEGENDTWELKNSQGKLVLDKATTVLYVKGVRKKGGVR